MSYVPARNRIDQMLSTSGDGAGGVGEVVFNVDGVAITGATTASPVVCTANGHGYVSGEWLWIDGGTGITEINGLRKVVLINANTFSLTDENGDAVNSAGTFGGTVDSQPALVIAPAANEVYHLNRMSIWIADASAWVVAGMLGLSALTNGIEIKLFNGTGAYKDLTPQAIKRFGDFVFLSGGPDTTGITDVSGNKYELGVRWTFSRIVEESKHTHDIRLDGSLKDMLVIYTPDDLAALSGLEFGVQGWKE